MVKSIFGEQISAWCVRGTIARFKNNNGLNGWKKWNRGAEKPTSKVWSRAVRWVGRGETRGWDRYWRGCHCWTMNNREDYTNTADLKGFIVDIWFIVMLLIYEEHFDRLIIMHSIKKNINVFPIYLGIVISILVNLKTDRSKRSIGFFVFPNNFVCVCLFKLLMWANI